MMHSKLETCGRLSAGLRVSESPSQAALSARRVVRPLTEADSPAETSESKSAREPEPDSSSGR
eukprot:1525155-Rhodomonas_salina.1